jgi:hypothetical protein
MKVISKIFNLFSDKAPTRFIDAKTGIATEAARELFTSNPEFPYLISFPRTGSHWLRMLMELYFEKPSLAIAFYYKNAQSFTCYHHHDVDLMIEGIKNVIYIYRNPIDTVYSLMKYHKEDIKNENRVLYWTNLYGNHLKKWLFEERFTDKKILIRYEDLKTDANSVFKALSAFFNQPFDGEKLKQAVQKATKENVKQKTLHDPQVINLSEDYEKERHDFKASFSILILGSIHDLDSRFVSIFRNAQ